MVVEVICCDGFEGGAVKSADINAPDLRDHELERRRDWVIGLFGNQVLRLLKPDYLKWTMRQMQILFCRWKREETDICEEGRKTREMEDFDHVGGDHVGI